MLALVNSGKMKFEELPAILQDSVVACQACKSYMLPTKKNPDICAICRSRKVNAAAAEVF
jgi:hypothetical protein